MTTTYTDNLGNEPNMNILSFVVSNESDAKYIKVFKRLDDADPTADVEVIEEMLANRVRDWYPYYHVLFNAENDVNYVVTYLDENKNEILTPANRIETENYFPPVPIQDNILLNQPRIGAEALRRLYIVLERMGEKAILLRKKRSGTRCECWRDQDGKALPSCGKCYGTGWIGGYDVFYPFLFDFQPAGERVSITNAGMVIDNQPRGWAVIVPRIFDGDFVVRLWGEARDRYEVNNPTRKDKDGVAGMPTIQEFSLYLHGKNHPIYNFPVEDYVSDYTRPTGHPSVPDRR